MYFILNIYVFNRKCRNNFWFAKFGIKNYVNRTNVGLKVGKCSELTFSPTCFFILGIHSYWEFTDFLGKTRLIYKVSFLFIWKFLNTLLTLEGKYCYIIGNWCYLLRGGKFFGTKRAVYRGNFNGLCFWNG